MSQLFPTITTANQFKKIVVDKYVLLITTITVAIWWVFTDYSPEIFSECRLQRHWRRDVASDWSDT